MRLLGRMLVLNFLMKLTLTGLENVPRSGPTMVLFNHLSLLEPVVVAIGVTNRDLVPMAKEELLENPFTGVLMRGWDAIPIRRGEVDIQAIKRAIDTIQSNVVLMIAPEGHRQTGLHDPKEGVAMLASRTGAVIVPVGLSGTQNFWRNLKQLRRTPVTVHIGQPFRLREGITRKQYARVMQEVMYRLAPLVEPDLRGDFADLSKATTETIEPI